MTVASLFFMVELAASTGDFSAFSLQVEVVA